MNGTAQYDIGSKSKDELFKDLVDILLEDERKKYERVETDIVSIREENSPETVFAKVQPIMDQRIDDKIEDIKNNMAELNGPMITSAIRIQIRENKDEFINILYPIMGKLIQKFIKVELQKLSEEIDRQIDSTFSFAAIKREFLALFGIKEKNQLIKNAASPVIQEVYVIEQGSGLLYGHYSKAETIDQDMVAGMLTAISSFVDSAFQNTSGDLDTIEYGTYTIIIQNSYKYFIAVVVSGIVDSAFKQKLLDYLFKFGEDYLTMIGGVEYSEEEISIFLAKYFKEFNA